MKKELVAVLLLALLALVSYCNLRRLNALTDSVIQAADAASAAVAQGDWGLARRCGSLAASRWNAAERYSTLVLPHSSLDAATEAFCGLYGALEGRDRGEFVRACSTLRERIAGIYEMEQLTLSSIF